MFQKKCVQILSLLGFITQNKNAGQPVWGVHRHALVELPEAASSGTRGMGGRRDESVQGFACSYDRG